MEARHEDKDLETVVERTDASFEKTVREQTRWIATIVFSAMRRLLEFPESGRPGRVVGTRELVVPRTPFIAVYSVTVDRLRILRILHGAQLWPDDIEPA